MSAGRLIGIVGCCALVLPWRLLCQPRRTPDLRAESDLVLVPVTVSDLRNHPVTCLTRDSFRLFDDGVEQTITHFALDDAPMTIGLVFDSSASMRFKIDRSRLAAAAFFHTANPEDEFFLVDFAGSARLAIPFTRDARDIEERIARERPNGHTALLDAIYLALNEMKKSSHGRKALLVMTDGGDNSSRYTRHEVLRALRESDTLIYAIGIFAPAGRRRSLEEMEGPDLLRTIAEASGGRLVTVHDTIELPYMAVKVGMEMRSRYVLGYSPNHIRDDGRYHHVHVKLVAPAGLPPLYASWRTGYFAPSR
jgi:Ca-activated chloride channel homolog